MNFQIKSITTIMEEFEYPGVRIMLEATLERMRQSMKLDLSTDDIITPSAVRYEYKLMFENRTIPLLAYNVETLLAEKMQTILARGIANTRMRDFYDVYEIIKKEKKKIDMQILFTAFQATCQKRETLFSGDEIKYILTKISEDENMAQMWEQFRKKSYFVGELQWDEVSGKVTQNIQDVVVENPFS